MRSKGTNHVSGLEANGVSSGTIMLETRSLQFHYPEGPSFRFPDITCPAKGHLLLLGQSGTGKTTLLHLLAGLLKADTGEVRIGDQNLFALSGKALDRFRGDHIGIVYQTAHFVDALDVTDNLLLPQFLTGKRIDKGKAKQVLERLGLGHKANAFPYNLSIGEQQRVSIARALMNDPDVILADEPSSALDDRNAAQVMDLLEEQSAAAGAALVIVTHDQRLKDRFPNRVEL